MRTVQKWQSVYSSYYCNSIAQSQMSSNHLIFIFFFGRGASLSHLVFEIFTVPTRFFDMISNLGYKTDSYNLRKWLLYMTIKNIYWVKWFRLIWNAHCPINVIAFLETKNKIFKKRLCYHGEFHSIWIVVMPWKNIGNQHNKVKTNEKNVICFYDNTLYLCVISKRHNNARAFLFLKKKT